jgi:hypothetical protein
MPTNDEQYTQEQILDYSFSALFGCVRALENLCEQTGVDLESRLTFTSGEESVSMELGTLLHRARAVLSILENELEKQ